MSRPDQPTRHRRRKVFVSTGERLRREGNLEGQTDELRSLLFRLVRARRGAGREQAAKLVPHLDLAELTTLVDRLVNGEDPAPVLAEMRADPRAHQPAPGPPADAWIKEMHASSRILESIQVVVARFRREGYRQGQLDALRNVLYRNMHRRFGPTPERLLAPIRHAGIDELLEWIDNLVGAESDAEVLADEDGLLPIDPYPADLP